MLQTLRSLIANPEFWRISAFGLIGTLSGVSGLLIAWISSRYQRPKIKIVRSELFVPSMDYVRRIIARNAILEYKLELVVANKRGGQGSIEKPRLVIRLPKEYVPRDVYVRPTVKELESLSESSTFRTFKEIRLGHSIELTGGDIEDAEIKYVVSGNDLAYVVKNYGVLEYFLAYRDNQGKSYRTRIQSVIS